MSIGSNPLPPIKPHLTEGKTRTAMSHKLKDCNIEKPKAPHSMIIKESDTSNKDLLEVGKSERANMADRFQLEQDILQCWNVVNDIKLVITSPEFQTKEKAHEALLAVATLYEIKFNRLFNTFEESLKST